MRSAQARSRSRETSGGRWRRQTKGSVSNVAINVCATQVNVLMSRPWMTIDKAAPLDACLNHRRAAPGEKSRGRFFVSWRVQRVGGEAEGAAILR